MTASMKAAKSFKRDWFQTNEHRCKVKYDPSHLHTIIREHARMIIG